MLIYMAKFITYYDCVIVSVWDVAFLSDKTIFFANYFLISQKLQFFVKIIYLPLIFDDQTKFIYANISARALCLKTYNSL